MRLLSSSIGGQLLKAGGISNVKSIKSGMRVENFSTPSSAYANAMFVSESTDPASYCHHCLLSKAVQSVLCWKPGEMTEQLFCMSGPFVVSPQEYWEWSRQDDLSRRNGYVETTEEALRSSVVPLWFTRRRMKCGDENTRYSSEVSHSRAV